VQVDDFKLLIEQKGRELYRDMPWRRDTRPYYILVSELMLQQTQVERVIPKFEAFIRAFPDESTLAQANLAEVLTLWQGLGYNRRAKYLHDSAKHIVQFYYSSFPTQVHNLLSLPGVGKNTAGALRVYAFNQPEAFIETNIRTVYFYHFFHPLDSIADNEILPLLQQTINHSQPRQFYWALMDYSSWLKRQGIKNVGQSKHYKKQSRLEGSVRQVRGQIIKQLAESGLAEAELERRVGVDERFDMALSGLVREGLVEYANGQLRLSRS
jgi:A/G-specific adenine glycosylase